MWAACTLWKKKDVLILLHAFITLKQKLNLFVHTVYTYSKLYSNNWGKYWYNILLKKYNKEYKISTNKKISKNIKELHINRNGNTSSNTIKSSTEQRK